MNVEAASGDIHRVVAEKLLVPGLTLPGGPHSHFAVIVQQLNADIHTLIANEAGSAFK